MFKNKENLKHFIGGAAVGVAAGLLTRKLLLPGVTVTDHGKFGGHLGLVYSKDDNNVGKEEKGKNRPCDRRSKSATRSVNESGSGERGPFEDVNLNLLGTVEKPNTNLNKLSGLEMHRIARRNENFRYNVKNANDTVKDSGNSKDKTLNNGKNLSVTSNKAVNVDVSRDEDSMVDRGMRNLRNVTKKDFSLSVNDAAPLDSLSNMENLMGDAFGFENFSNVATFNSLRNLEQDEDFDEFFENDLVSSTKFGDCGNL